MLVNFEIFFLIRDEIEKISRFYISSRDIDISFKAEACLSKFPTSSYSVMHGN